MFEIGKIRCATRQLVKKFKKYSNIDFEIVQKRLCRTQIVFNQEYNPTNPSYIGTQGLNTFRKFLKIRC